MLTFAGDLRRDEREDTLQSTNFVLAALDIAQEAQAVMQHKRIAFTATGAEYTRALTSTHRCNSPRAHDPLGTRVRAKKTAPKTAPTPCIAKIHGVATRCATVLSLQHKQRPDNPMERGSRRRHVYDAP